MNVMDLFMPILFGFNGVRLWICLPTALIVILNFLVFIVYQQSHQGKSLAEQLWGYFESSVFGGLTASLLFPIFLSLLERRFRIIEKRQQELKERQLESIKESSQRWNEFYGVINEIIFYVSVGKNSNIICDILKKLDDNKSKTIDLITTWKTRFPGLTTEDIDMIKYFENMLYSAAKSVGNFIKENQALTETCKLQESLGIIQRVVGNYGHYYGLQILLSITQLEGAELSSKKGECDSEIEKLLETMRGFINKFKELESEHNTLISSIEGERARNVRDEAGRIQNWMKEHHSQNIDSDEFHHYEKTDEFKNFVNLFRQIPIEKRAHSEKFPYSKDYIFFLADYLSVSTVIGDIRNKTYYLQNNISNVDKT
jgi:hypothetical protein